MTIHLIKLCVGTDSIEDLKQWQDEKLRRARAEGRKKPYLWHRTRMFPRRREEVLDGGSLYWVIKGIVQVRQAILDLKAVTGDDGIERCDIVLKRELVPVRPVPRRAFQGWRYLDPDDAPPDLGKGNSDLTGMPAEMRSKLMELGLI